MGNSRRCAASAWVVTRYVFFRSIVKPDATPEEIRAVVNDDQGGQVFAQAVGFQDNVAERSTESGDPS